MKKTLALILACLLITGCGPVPERLDEPSESSSSVSQPNSVPDESASENQSLSSDSDGSGSSSSSASASSSKPQSSSGSSSSSTPTSSSKPQSSSSGSSSSASTSSSKPQSSSNGSSSSSATAANTQTPPPNDIIGNYNQRSQAAWEIEYANEVFQLVNKERANAGLPEFKKLASLTESATVRAWECLISYGHERPDGRKFSTALDEQSIRWKSCGENIAAGQRTPQQVVTAWMNSPGHRANILSEDFTYLGVGFYYDYNGADGTYRYYWAQNFCTTF